MTIDRCNELRDVLVGELNKVRLGAKRGTYKRRIAYNATLFMLRIKKRNLSNLLMLYNICANGYLRDLIHDCCMLLGLFYDLPYWTLTQDWKTDLMKNDVNSTNIKEALNESN